MNKKTTKHGHHGHHNKGGMTIYRRDASTEDIYVRDGDGARFRLDDHGNKRLDLIPCRGPRPKRADETADTSAPVAEPARHLIAEAAETASSPSVRFWATATGYHVESGKTGLALDFSASRRADAQQLFAAVTGYAGPYDYPETPEPPRPRLVCHYCGDAITNEDETAEDGAGHPVHAACQEAAEDAADELAQNDPE